MSILSSYFDKIYCINLDERIERWTQSKEEFSRVGFNEVTRFSGINGATLDLSNVYHNTYIDEGHRGVTETHIEIISEAKKNKYNSIMIMEDDVYFTDEVFNLSKFMQSVPKDWDALYFGGKNLEETSVVNKDIVRLNKTYNLHCFAIKNTIYDSALSLLKERLHYADGSYAILQKTEGVNTYGVTPFFAYQRAGYSDTREKFLTEEEINNNGRKN